MKKILCFDLDNVICFTNKKKQYSRSKPNLNAIKVINKLYKDGHMIKIFTARGMGKFNGKTSLVKKAYLELTKKQLKKWGVLHHKLIMCKPSYDLFVDDKAYGFDKNWTKKIFRKLI